jgi:hypothetical protein
VKAFAWLHHVRRPLEFMVVARHLRSSATRLTAFRYMLYFHVKRENKHEQRTNNS